MGRADTDNSIEGCAARKSADQCRLASDAMFNLFGWKLFRICTDPYWFQRSISFNRPTISEYRAGGPLPIRGRTP